MYDDPTNPCANMYSLSLDEHESATAAGDTHTLPAAVRCAQSAVILIGICAFGGLGSLHDVAQAAGTELFFYGDSLTELWRGTAWGYNSRLGPGIPAVFSRYFGQYSSVIAGAGGTTHLCTTLHDGHYLPQLDDALTQLPDPVTTCLLGGAC